MTINTAGFQALSKNPELLTKLRSLGYELDATNLIPPDQAMQDVLNSRTQTPSTAKRVAKGKGLIQTQAQRVPSSTSARKTNPRNPQRDQQGYRQVSRYAANKRAASTLEVRTDESRIEEANLQEVRDRGLNPGNRHYQGNPLIQNGRVVR